MSPLAPQKKSPAKNLSEMISSSNAHRLWGKSPLLAIINPAISNADFRVLALLAVAGLGGEAIISMPEIALALRWNERTVSRSLVRLEKLGAVDVSRKPNQPNAYRIKSEVFGTLRRETKTERVMRTKPVLTPCLKCRKLCRPNKAGWCRGCAKDVELDGRIIRTVDGRLASRGVVCKQVG